MSNSDTDTEDVIPATPTPRSLTLKAKQHKTIIRTRKRKATTHDHLDENEGVNLKTLMKLNKDKAWKTLKCKRKRNQSQTKFPDFLDSSSSDEFQNTRKIGRKHEQNDTQEVDDSDSDIDLPSVLMNTENDKQIKNGNRIETQKISSRANVNYSSSDMSETEWEQYITSLTNPDSPQIERRNTQATCRDKYIRDSLGIDINDLDSSMFNTPDLSGSHQTVSDNMSNASPSSPVFHTKAQRKGKHRSVIAKSPKARHKHKMDNNNKAEPQLKSISMENGTDKTCTGDSSQEACNNGQTKKCVSSPDVEIIDEQPSTSRRYSQGRLNAEIKKAAKKQTTLHSYRSKVQHSRNSDYLNAKHSSKRLIKKSREATRSRAPEAAVFDPSLTVSPATQQAVEQFENDETLARRLQEEMDREYASSLVTQPVTSDRNPPGPVSTRANHQPADSDDRLSYELHMSERIAALSEYEWQLHQAVHHDHDLPDAPADVNTSIGEILDQEILEYLESGRNNQASVTRMTTGKRRSSLMDRSPVRLRTRGSRATPEASSTTTSGAPVAMSRALAHLPSRSARNQADLLQLQSEADIYFRIGMMPDEEWQIYRNVYFDENVGAARRSRRGRRNARDLNLDTEIMNILVQANQPVPRGARGRNRRMNLDNMEYEELLALSERIGDAKKKGLSSTEITLLPTKQYKAAEPDAAEQTDMNKACNVCLCDYESGDQQRILPCFHEYHTRCIDKWLKNNATCPVCRKEVKLG